LAGRRHVFPVIYPIRAPKVAALFCDDFLELSNELFRLLGLPRIEVRLSAVVSVLGRPLVLQT
jgi:hypothetical protein